MHPGVAADDRRLGRRACHQLLDAHEPLAQLAARMQVGEVLLAETLGHEQRHGERIAEGERGRGARRGHQVQRARLLRHAAIERDVGRLAEGGPAVAGDGDQSRAEPLDRLQQAQDLVGLAAARERHDDVVGLDDAKVAVNRFGRMEEEGRRAGARQRGGDLAADDARLAHAGDDHAAAALEEEAHRLLEAVIEAIDEREDRGRFCLRAPCGRGRDSTVGQLGHDRAASDRDPGPRHRSVSAS